MDLLVPFNLGIPAFDFLFVRYLTEQSEHYRTNKQDVTAIVNAASLKAKFTACNAVRRTPSERLLCRCAHTALLTPRNDVEGAVRSLPYRTIRTLLYIWIG